jgi:hypothetical protein
MPRQIDEEVSAKVPEHLKKCYVRPATGPAVRLELKYKIDGTFAQPPHPLNPESIVE